MISPLETQFTKRGDVTIHNEIVNIKKPAWLVLLKLLVLLAVLPVSFVLIVPQIPLPTLESSLVVAAVLVIYVLLAYFVRPEANTDNMGWAGGSSDDPFQFNDDINRLLYKANFMLAPGRFIAYSFRDLLTLCRIMPEVTQEQAEQIRAEQSEMERSARKQEILARVEARQAERGSAVTLSSAKYLNPAQVSDQ